MAIRQKTKAGEKLIFITKDNIKTSLTKDIAERYFPKGFDIDQFLNDGPKKQRETLQKIVGLDFTDVDTRYKQAYENRTFANKSLEAAKAKLIPVNDSLEDSPIDTLPIQQEIAGVEAHNEKYNYTKKNGIEDRKSKRKEHEEEIARLKSEIERVHKEIKEKEEAIDNINSDILKGNQWIEVKANQPKTTEEVEELNTKLQTAIEINKSIEDNKKAIQIREEYQEAEKQAKDADALVKTIEQEKTDLIKSAKLPVGFDFSDDGITYLGHAFTKEQLSSSAIYIAALKLASLNIGEVKTLHFDASYLDKNSLEEIETWATTNNLQLLIERPDFEGGEIEYHLLNDAI